MGARWKGLTETLSTSTHNLCNCDDVRKMVKNELPLIFDSGGINRTKFGATEYQLKSNIPMSIYKWTLTRDTLSSGVCKQRRCRPACASAPLLFPFWKVSYLNLLQAKFQFSS